MQINLPLRPKRLRQNSVVRALLRETQLSATQLIAPLFISEIHQHAQEITSMPGVFQLPLDALADEIDSLVNAGIHAVLLFGLPAHKDAHGSSASDANGIVQQAIRLIKQLQPHLLVIADVCLCEYTEHGHCGVLTEQRTDIDNDQTLKKLSEIAISYAQAGVDWVAPSSMTDGMVTAIRTGLDHAGFTDVAILSYAVKYSSCLYGPFREAALGAPQFGDRKAYQMDPANVSEAIREAQLDIAEGADLIMVKPAGLYLDIICRMKQQFPSTPLCAYQVSGEYAMIKTAARLGLIEETAAMLEHLIAIKRAGADLIITYFAKPMAQLLKENPYA
jgi:porphobilinogen synthase